VRACRATSAAGVSVTLLSTSTSRASAVVGIGVEVAGRLGGSEGLTLTVPLHSSQRTSKYMYAHT